MHRIYNFSPGPAILPESVLEEAAQGVREIHGSGMSVLEVSHRGKQYDGIHAGARETLLRVLGLSADEYTVLFVQGGASLQFALLPMNFLADGRTANYVNAGEWGSKAIKEAKKVGKGEAIEIATSADKNFSYIPKGYAPTPGAAYLHVTTNNTIEGTELYDLPETGGVPLVTDASSDFMALNRDHSKFSLLYAGAQKNAGPAGVTIVVARKAFLETALGGLPSMLAYKTYVDSDSLYNTPPVFAIYVVGLVAKWVEAQGGLVAIEKANREKAAVLYSAIDELSDVFYGTVTAKEDRSLMNVTFRLQPKYAELEKEFVAEAAKRGLDGLKGHRSVGGFRASIYNAFPLAGTQALAAFMREFAAAKG
ncbi:MAG: 3-phosphoserine/phosphohydroxythreonine transaminase [Capsulimonadaceae bacterium]|nr:3-phosphoserine/phosphohydroxythreonine transaminase [Capsulimonadaceae bacterium]